MTFEEWWNAYRKGQWQKELVTLDETVKAAFTAGKSTRDCADCDNQLYTVGYAEGVQAERERCARIAESYDSKTEYNYACYDQGKDDAASDIAEAIRGQANET